MCQRVLFVRWLVQDLHHLHFNTLKSPFKTTARMVFGGMIADRSILLPLLLRKLVRFVEI